MCEEKEEKEQYVQLLGIYLPGILCSDVDMILVYILYIHLHNTCIMLFIRTLETAKISFNKGLTK